MPDPYESVNWEEPGSSDDHSEHPIWKSVMGFDLGNAGPGSG